MSSPATSTRQNPIPRLGCGYAVCVLLALIGIALLFAAEAKWRNKEPRDAWIVGSIGGVFCFAAIGLIAPMQRTVASAKERRQREEAKPDEPWTWEPAWLERSGIPQSGRRNSRAMVVCGVMAVLFSLPVLFALPKEVARGNFGIMVALLFPVLGLAFLSVAATDWLRRRKYGLARFVPASVPLPFGAEVAGMILVNRRIVPLRSGRVALDCHRATVSQHGGKRRERDEVVAHTEREISPNDWTVTATESRLFVQLPIRGGAATTMTRLQSDSPTYEWRLVAKVPTEGADFAAEFVLPVFEIAGAATSAGVDAPSVTSPQLNRTEAFRAAGILEEIKPGADGRTALVLPVGQGRGLAGGPIAMALIFGATALVLWFTPVPAIIVIFFALFSFLPALVVKALWSGGGERVWVEGKTIMVERDQLVLRRIPIAEVQAVEARKTVGIGTQQFYRVVARCPPLRERRFPRRVEIASMLRGEEAAAAVIDWLEERLTKTVN